MTTGKRYNISLCYHGISTSADEVHTFVTYIEDFKQQIDHLRDQGYVFVTADDFLAWYKGTKTFDTPIAKIIFDDALESVPIAAEWLIKEKIPFAVAVIARRLQRKTPEPGFMSWEQLRDMVDTGFCSLIQHTYNGHHLLLAKYADGSDEVISAPFLERPAWRDNGEFIYMKPEETRQYFDYGIPKVAWGFPLMGTDPHTGDLISSSVNFVASKDTTVSVLRMWASLHYPASSGYDIEVEVFINGELVADTVFEQTHYDTRSQWKEREFASLELDTPYQIRAGQEYEISFETKNKGTGAFRVYALQEFDQPGFELMTTCTEQDFPPGYVWNARACLILGDGTGIAGTDEFYNEYIEQDFANFEQALNDFLHATWTPHKNPYTESGSLEVCVLAGTYSDGSKADTWLRYRPDASFTAEVLRFKYAIRYGERYPLFVDVWIGERTGDKTFTNERKVARFPINWADYKQFEVDIDPFLFEAGKDYLVRFVTINSSPLGQGLVTITMDQPAAPSPSWDSAANDWAHLGSESYAHDVWYSVAQAEGTNLYPTGTYTDKNGDWQWKYDELDGAGITFLDFFDRQATPSALPTQICFPFGAYYDIGEGSAEIQPIDNVNPLLRTIMQNHGIVAGWSIYPTRIVPESIKREPELRYGIYSLPRLLVYGTVAQDIVLNNIDAYTGALWADVRPQGVTWQGFEEYDPYWNGTIRNAALDNVAFDTYYLRTDGTVQKGEINQGDKDYLQSRGVDAYIIFSNFSFDTGEFDADVAHYVLTNKDVFIPQMVDICVNENWDGITVDLEGVYGDDRELMNEFIRDLAPKIHAAGKKITISLPAATGTSYDSYDWAGFADYAELIKHVDLMQVMTYTESGEFSDPLPHAPDEFFAMVYDYIKQIIPPKYRRRILVGANSYGHMWMPLEVDEDTGEEYRPVEYVSYHTALAEATKAGAFIQGDEGGEARWEKNGIACVFGSPKTIQRAVDKAIEMGMAGVGVWKADDGDALEHWQTQQTTRKLRMNAKFKRN